MQTKEEFSILYTIVNSIAKAAYSKETLLEKEELDW